MYQQLEKKEEQAAVKQPQVQRKEQPNKTGLPDNLKSGIERLSGYDMSDVRVHYNSAKPAQLNAHAYAQGSQIHVASGQEKHVAHEAWHVVQQKQGRVRPTMNFNGQAINDNVGLEREADVMGGKALQMKLNHSTKKLQNKSQKTIQKKSSFHLPKVAQRLTDEEIEEKYKNDVSSMNKLQIRVIKDIVKIDGWQAFRGGHVAVNGNKLFLKWRTFNPRKIKKGDKAAKRGQGFFKGSLGSSHYPGGGTQFEIRLPNLWFGNNWGTVLFGLRRDPTTGVQQTWFQVEGHSGTMGESKLRFITDVLMHGADFVKHKRYGRSLMGGRLNAPVVNVGPFGEDLASEKTGTERIY